MIGEGLYSMEVDVSWKRSVKHVAERGELLLLFVTVVLYAIRSQESWPRWVMLVVGCAGSILFIAVWLMQSTGWREQIGRYAGDSKWNKIPGGVFTWQRGVRSEAAMRYGREAARLTVRSVRRILLSKMLYCVFGLVVFGGFVAAAWGDGNGGYVPAGAVLVLGMVLGLLGVVDCRAAGAQARALDVDQRVMQGVLMARESYLISCREYEQEPYPFNGQGEPRVA